MQHTTLTHVQSKFYNAELAASALKGIKSSKRFKQKINRYITYKINIE